MNNQENEISIVVKESGLETNQANGILTKFTTFFEQAKEWETKAKGIMVTDESQTELMAQSREARLELKKIRTDAEKVRKAMKEDYIRTGKAIDGVYNVIEALIVPIEKHLEKQEKFVENIAKEKADKLKEYRTSELMKYVEDVSVYNFDSMSEEVFANLLSSVKMVWEHEQEVIKAEEEKRIADEKLEKEEAEKNKIEVEKLRKEKEEREAQEKKDKEIADAKLAAEKKKADDAEKALADEKKKQAEIQAKKDADEKKEKEEAIELERQKALMPDKVKLLEYAESLKTLKSPEGLSKAGLEVVKTVEGKLLELSQYIRNKTKEL